MTDATEPWRRLCELLDDDPEPARVVIAADDAERTGALLDGLDDSGALAYLDWTDSGVELADALAQLPRVFRTGADLDEVGDVTGGLRAAIARADELLAAHGLSLLYLEEDADACPLVAVPTTDAAEIIDLAGRCGAPVRSALRA